MMPRRPAGAGETFRKIESRRAAEETRDDIGPTPYRGTHPAVAGHRVLARAEARIVAALGAALLVGAGLAFRWPRLLAWPLALLLVWLGSALLARAWRLRRGGPMPEERTVDPGFRAGDRAGVR